MSDESTKKPEGTGTEIMLLLQEISGGVITSATLAEKIGELLCEALYGGSELERQRPLIAADRGDSWRVQGSWNHDQRIEGPGAFFVSMQKRDGRITDIGRWWAYGPHPVEVPVVEPKIRKPGPKASN